MNDFELMKLAAKAVGINVYESIEGTDKNNRILVRSYKGEMGKTLHEEWNPLRDNHSAMILMGILNMNFEFDFEDRQLFASCYLTGELGHPLGGEEMSLISEFCFDEIGTSKPYRRASVGLAACIGKMMK